MVSWPALQLSMTCCECKTAPCFECLHASVKFVSKASGVQASLRFEACIMLGGTAEASVCPAGAGFLGWQSGPL